MAALRRRDRTSYVAAAPGSPSAAAVYAALIACRPRSYRIALDVSPRVEVLTLGLPSSTEQDIGFDVTAFGTGSAFWRRWPAVVRTRTRYALVLGSRTSSTATTAALDRALAAAARVLGEPVAPLLVLAPPDASGFTALTGLSGDLAAACTLLPRPPGTPTSRQRPLLVLGPELPSEEASLLSVLTHEAAHALLTLQALAAGAEADEAPAWLREGLAEWVSVTAWRQQAATARHIDSYPQVRADPASRPTAADFAAGGQRREIAYLRAYLAVERIVRRDGLDQLKLRYRKASKGTGH